MTYLEILKWNERDILNSIEKEKQKPQNDLTIKQIKTQFYSRNGGNEYGN